MARSRGSGKYGCPDWARHGYHKQSARERKAIVQALSEFPETIIYADERPLEVTMPKPAKRAKGRKWKQRFQ